MEGKLVANLLARMAEADGLAPEAIQTIKNSVALLEKIMDGLGFCLSEEGDLLSQWRGYAADASGVSIGFSKEYLMKISEASQSKEKSGFNLKKVAYEIADQEIIIGPTVKDKNFCKQNIIDALKFHGYDTDKIIIADSKIPYRK